MTERAVIQRNEPVVRVENLSVEYTVPEGKFHAVKELSYELRAGEVLAIIGESGSGKSTGAETLLGLQDETPGASVTGSVFLGGRDVTLMDRRELEAVRGSEIAIVFQDPGAALNPALTIGYQFREFLKLKLGLNRREARQRTIEILQSVGLKDAERRLNDLPYQLSGGMRQRAMIGLAIALEPSVLVADEPTTALDVTVQAEILRLIKRLVAERNMGVLFISHDLAVARELADRIGVMYGGRLVELGNTEEVIAHPAHPYTQALLRSTPSMEGERELFVPIKGSPPDPMKRPAGCSFHPRCEYAMPECSTVIPELRSVVGAHLKACHLEVTELPDLPRQLPLRVVERAAVETVSPAEPLLSARELRREFTITTEGRKSTLVAVQDASFDLFPRETLALVGESGSGKSTVSRMVAGLLKPTSGSVQFQGASTWDLDPRSLRAMRRHIQMVFQDPWSSLNPRMTVGDIIAEPWRVNNPEYGRRKRRELTTRLLDDVGLRSTDAGRRARELSGGQRQRVAIARALTLRPSVLVCDEPLSALDVSVQAQILNLLRELQVEYEMSYLFISHDLAVVKQLADRVIVMHDGAIVETGDVDEIYDSPREDYTRALLASIPGQASA
jgi:peptide/nickel transport system ATP-binding protein